MKIYLVGGCVRDKLLGIKISDRDWVVVGSTYKEMLSLGYKSVGNSFPVFIHPKTKEEYALARTEKKNGNKHNSFLCNSSNVTLKEDLFRRDLTINAIAMDKYGCFYDPYKGIIDLKNKVIRHVSYSFIEDSLRVLRVARFYSYLYNLKFYIFNLTLKLMKKIVFSGDLLNISSERIWKETEKSFKGLYPSKYFYILYKCNALENIYPEFSFSFNKKENLFYFNYLLDINININLNILIEIRFVYLSLFINKTILYKNFFMDKKKFIYDLNFLVKRLNIPKKFLFLSINFFKFINLININYFLNKKVSIILIESLYSINIWNKPDYLYKFIIIINYIKHLPLNNKFIYYFLSFYLKRIYSLLNNINIKKFIKLGYCGLEMKNKIYNLRLSKINSFLNKEFIIN